MANFYGNDQIERLKNNIDIVNIIESYVPLKKQGINFTACCPFHEEKTPSFVVFPESQSFHCFGGACSKGGDVIHFVQEIDKLTFSEAVEYLAERTGVKLVSERSSADDGRGSRKKDMFKANSFAQEFFVGGLTSPAGQTGRKYLLDRGITEETIRTFGLGFSAPGLLAAIRKAKLPLAPFEEAGLLGKRDYDGSFYERFRNRVMFPIRDLQGRFTGFGGRILESGGDNKYINSPGSIVFSKKENLYGIEFLKEIRGSESPVVVVEGYTDVIGLYQTGFKGAVATLGTALTGDHIRHLKRFTRRLVMIFDADNAGLKAAEKSINLFVTEDMEVSFVTLPGGQDPFDFVTAEGLDAFNLQLQSAASMYAFKRTALERRHPEHTPDSLNQVITSLARTFSPVPSAVKRELVFKQIADDFSISLESLEKAAAGEKRKRRAPAPEPAPPADSPAQEQAERDVIRTYMAFPLLFLKTYERLNPELVQTAKLRMIYEKSIQQFEDDLVFLPEKLLSYIDNAEQAGQVAGYMHADDMDEEQAAAVNRESVRFILLKNYEREENKLKAQYMKAESAGDETSARKFVSLLDIIQKQKHALVR